MRGFALIAIVIGVFFVVGIAVGMLAVVALPRLQSARRDRHNRRLDGGIWWELPPPGDDDERRPPRWPGA
jgi:hypothetical protein